MSQPEYPNQQQYPQYPQQQQQPGGAYYNPGQPPVYSGQQQQPTVVVVQSAPAPQNFVCHYVLSCFVFWCCGWLFGLVAFILAVVAQSKATQDANSARQLGKASIGVSIAGIVVGVIILIVVIVMNVVLVKTATDTIKSCQYFVNDQCYRTRELALTPNICFNNGYYNSLDKYCYYK